MTLLSVLLWVFCYFEPFLMSISWNIFASFIRLKKKVFAEISQGSIKAELTVAICLSWNSSFHSFRALFSMSVIFCRARDAFSLPSADVNFLALAFSWVFQFKKTWCSFFVTVSTGLLIILVMYRWRRFRLWFLNNLLKYGRDIFKDHSRSTWKKPFLSNKIFTNQFPFFGGFFGSQCGV